MNHFLTAFADELIKVAADPPGRFAPQYAGSIGEGRRRARRAVGKPPRRKPARIATPQQEADRSTIAQGRRAAQRSTAKTSYRGANPGMTSQALPQTALRAGDPGYKRPKGLKGKANRGMISYDLPSDQLRRGDPGYKPPEPPRGQPSNTVGESTLSGMRQKRRSLREGGGAAPAKGSKGTMNFSVAESERDRKRDEAKKGTMNFSVAESERDRKREQQQRGGAVAKGPQRRRRAPAAAAAARAPRAPRSGDRTVQNYGIGKSQRALGDSFMQGGNRGSVAGLPGQGRNGGTMFARPKPRASVGGLAAAGRLPAARPPQMAAGPKPPTFKPFVGGVPKTQPAAPKPAGFKPPTGIAKSTIPKPPKQVATAGPKPMKPINPYG